MKPIGFLSRTARHARLSWRALGYGEIQPPPFLIVFINSICNLTCEHCFYWQNLNKRDDLTFEEFEKLSANLGQFEILNLSGGEPYLRPEFAEIVDLFVNNNGVKQIYVPTNGYFTERTLEAMRKVMKNPKIQFFVNEISLDGTPAYHDEFRGNPKSFAKAMETYDALAELQAEDPRARIHAISTATHENMHEIRGLTELLHERCPDMDHHNLAIIRGDRKNPSLMGPQLAAYRELYEFVRTLWHDREEGRFGSIVEPLLQWAKTRAAEAQRQVVPCKAGTLTGVVHANGDVAVCEEHEPIGSLRKNTFREIWSSPEAEALREKIKNKECWCTNEVFMWPSIVYQPTQLARAIVGGKPWSKPEPPTNGASAG